MSLFNGPKTALVKQAHDWFKESQRRSKPWRTDALDDFKFYAGDQWETDDVQILKDQERPVVTFNRSAPTIDAVTGAERANRQEVRFLPRTLDDSEVNEQYTAVARWLRDECDAEDEESEAFLDTLVTGMGWTDTWEDFETDLDGKTIIERVPCLQMYWDPDARKRNLSDTRWRMRIKMLSRETIKEIWPNARLAGLEQSFDVQIVDDPHDAEEAKFYKNDQSDRRKAEDIPVAQLQWWERRPVFRVVNPGTGQQEVLTPSELQIVEDELETELPKVRQTRREYFQAFIVGKTLLAKSELHKYDQNGVEKIIPGFTLLCITGKRDEDKNCWFGIVRAMKDPQRWSNKFYSQMMDIMNSTSKGGLLAEKTSFENARKAEEDWTRADKIVWVADGALRDGRVQERQPASTPPAIDRLLALAMQAVRDTSGVNIEFLGLAARTQSGIVESSRIQQGLLVLGQFFDSLRKYRKEQGRILLHFIYLYVPDQEIIRVVGQDRYIQFSKDPDIAKYDIIVDQSPMSPNLKQEVWQGLQQILPALTGAGIPIPPDVLDYLPLPASAVSKFKKFFDQQQPSDEQRRAQIEALLLEVEQARAEVGKTESERFENIAKGIRQLSAIEGDRESRQIEAMDTFVKLLGEVKDEPRSADRGNGAAGQRGS